MGSFITHRQRHRLSDLIRIIYIDNDAGDLPRLISTRGIY